MPHTGSSFCPANMIMSHFAKSKIVEGQVVRREVKSER